MNARKKKIGQDDLRRIMKEKQGGGGGKAGIDSPLAKYDSLGHLVCKVCNCRIKNDLLWKSHTLSRSHKDSVERLRTQTKAPAVEKEVALKRKLSTETSSSNLGPPTKTRLLATYPSSSSEDEMDVSEGKATGGPATSSGASGLPSDFFDSAPGSSMPETPTSAINESPMEVKEDLPEGFFDDPKKDAKARKVEYVDKDEEEMAKFQREMKEAAAVSEAIAEADDEQGDEERTLGEVDEQLERWSNIQTLWEKKEARAKEINTAMPSAQKDDEGNNSDSDDDDDYDIDDDDWKTKRVTR